MKGFKAFEKGMICNPTGCNPYQFAENTTFEEESAQICNKGFHFCENPFDVIDYYGYVKNGQINEFAEVEALDEVCTDDNKKFATRKIKIGAKLGISGLVNAFIDFTYKKIDFDNAAATNTGNRSAATNTGDYSAATNTGKNGFAIATGIESKAKGALGCYIAVAEWAKDENGEYYIVNFKTHKVDGKTIKEDTFYTLKNGRFVKTE